MHEHRAARVDDRREARHLHRLAVPQAGVEEVGGEDRVGHVVERGDVVLATRRVVHPTVLSPRVVPAAHVPLVERDSDLPAAEAGLLEDADGLHDGLFGTARLHHPLEVRTLVRPAAVVVVDAHVVEQVAGRLEKRKRPPLVRRRGRKEVDPAVRAAHHLRALPHERAPLRNGLRAHFPAAPVLVADAPVQHVVRLRVAVRDALASPLADIEVAVLHPVAHLLLVAGAGVRADVRLATDLAAPLHVFVRAERVGVLDLPRLVPHRLALGPDAVLPVVGRDEAAARPAHDRHLDLAQGLDHVLAETVLVGERMPRPEEPAVHLPVVVLDELAEDHRAVLDRLPALHRRNGRGTPRRIHRRARLQDKSAVKPGADAVVHAFHLHVVPAPLLDRAGHPLDRERRLFDAVLRVDPSAEDDPLAAAHNQVLARGDDEAFLAVDLLRLHREGDVAELLRNRQRHRLVPESAERLFERAAAALPHAASGGKPVLHGVGRREVV